MPDLTLPEWEFLYFTPANGSAYYNTTIDKLAIKYNSQIKVYFNRREGYKDNNYPCYFSDCDVFDFT